MVKVLDRESINRMTGNRSSGGGGGGGSVDIDLSGYATEMWVEDKYVNKEFFSSLFKAYDANGNEVLPNDTETAIDNIKAMFGFWTDFYISALGTGGHQSVDLRLAQLADVNVAGVTNGQVLTYDSTTGKWIASTPQSGTDMATVWANLAANGNQQINASHLSTALTGYATQTWVGQQGYITASAISDMATKTWAEQNYVNKEFFSSLFKALDANGNEVLPNDTATTIDSIKAMFGFWTDFYISALGTGGQSTVGLRLAQLADVNVAGVTNGQVLTYNSTTGKWVASTPQSGTDMATVWANLAANGNQQIDASHLSTALTGYATQTWVTNQGYITASAISDMATKTWVGQQGYITSSAISDMATKTWVGQQGYQTQSTADGRYLKLSGGTLTGSLTVGSDLTVNGGVFWLQEEGGQPRMVFHIPNQNWANITMKSNGEFYLYKTNVETNGLAGLNLGGLYAQDTVFAYKTNDAAGTYWNSPALCVGGNYDSAHIEIDSNEIMAKSNASTTTTLYLNAEGGNCVINETAGNCGIGTGSPSHKLHVNGGIYSTSYVTALSDAKHKDIIGDTGLTVEQIAGAPAILFTWKDRDDKTVFAGSIAQYWQKVLPEVVQSQADGTLSLDYQVAALISSITVARKLMNHESRLQRLERMFAINEDDLED